VLPGNENSTSIGDEEVRAKQGIVIAVGGQLRRTPAAHDTDGFCAAVLERKAG